MTAYTRSTYTIGAKNQWLVEDPNPNHVDDILLFMTGDTVAITEVKGPDGTIHHHKKVYLSFTKGEGDHRSGLVSPFEQCSAQGEQKSYEYTIGETLIFSRNKDSFKARWTMNLSLHKHHADDLPGTVNDPELQVGTGYPP